MSSRVRCRLLGWSVREVDPASLDESCERVLIGAARQLCFRVSLPFPRLSGAGQQSAGKIASTPPPPHAGGREGEHSKMGRAYACVRACARLSPTSPCLGSVPICRFKIPLEMAQATPALERHLSSTSGLQACPSFRCRFLLHSKTCRAPSLSAEGGARGDAAAQELARARTSSV